MKKSEIEFNNLMFHNKIIALLQKTERLEQRRYLGKEKAVAHIEERLNALKEQRNKLTHEPVATTELTKLIREKEIIKYDYSIALCEEELEEIIQQPLAYELN